MAAARIQVQDAAAVVQQAPEDMNHTQNPGLRTGAPEMTYEEMQLAMSDCLSHHACSDDAEDEEDDDEHIEQGKLGEGDEPGCMIGKMSKMVEQHMQRVRQKQMKLDNLTHPECEVTVDYFHE